MPDLMAAADILVTKAGPATITEAFTAALPVILSDAIPGQEDGNVQFVIENEAGLYANTPAKVAAAVADWLERGPAFLAERSASAHRLAQPDAVWLIADEILENLRA
jgi:1,2-diacylglycerol 3-beta-galactosyltransferase